jgi:protein-tyrosine phosphatase
MMSIPLARPIPDCYWVEPGFFMAGEYPGHPMDIQARQRITAFLEAGFNTFFDLTQEGELEPYEPLLYEYPRNRLECPISYQRFPIGDYGLPAKVHMKNILDSLDSAIASGRKVYLHCWGGVGRTGTAVGCYLVRKGKTGEEALQQLERWWQAVPKHARFPRSPETDAQVQFILNWKD